MYELKLEASHELKLKMVGVMKVIQPAQTECAVPTGFVRKKKGSERFCVQYCRLIIVTIP